MENKDLGPKTPEQDPKGNDQVEKDNGAKSSGESNPQDGKNVVNEQDQNDIVNGQNGAGIEEFVDSAANNTRKGNDSALNNENSAAPGHSAAMPKD